MPLEAYLCSRRQPKENNELIVNTPQQTFRAALGQFFVKETSTENLAAARSLIERSETAGADLLVLPECIIARKLGMPEWGQKQAEPLDGPFVSGLREATRPSRDSGLHCAGKNCKRVSLCQRFAGHSER